MIPYLDCKETVKAFNLSADGDTMWVRDTNIFGIKVQRSWHPNRQPKEIAHFNDKGQRHGLRETWREDGTRIDSTMYEDGNIIEIREYFYNGNIRQFMKDKEGKLYSAIFYDPKGKVTGRIEKGTGKSIGFSEDGKQRWLDVYENGRRVDSRELEPGENPSLR
ncbi:hypothetical protein CHISP_3493 [Chitinispirillum alkaliphilum]|nr:hypothetical protein CHISP_3493 [Chitinispirillum alkaliphilum]